MALDLNRPVTTDNYSTGVLPVLRDNHLALAKFLEGESIVGNRVGVKRYNQVSQVFERWNGSAWVEMGLAYLKAADYTPADVLAKMLSVDGSGSGLDADVLRGRAPAVSNTANTIVLRDGNGDFSARIISAALSGNASSATQLQNARSFSISGGATATAVNFNGTANITLEVTALNASNLSAGTVPAARLGGSPTFQDLSLNGNTLTFNPSSGNAAIEIGRTGGASSPLIDFHSGATATDFDSRIIASGGNGSNRGGTLQYEAALHRFLGGVEISGVNMNTAKSHTLPRGHQRLPGGLILQWGHVSCAGDQTAQAAFDIAFPAQCLAAATTIQRGQGDGQGNVYSAHIVSTTTTQITVGVTDAGFSVGTVNVHFLAIGF